MAAWFSTGVVLRFLAALAPLLCLLAVLSGAETITDIANFGARKLAFLRRFRSFAGGTPSHDHLGDILATLDADAFQHCFVAWVSSLTGMASEVIAIDGKTVRRSKGAKAAIHMVSAFAARQRLVLGQVKVADKANEIVAIPRLLEMLEIEGAIITIDAMGCQRAITRQIIDQKADYVCGESISAYDIGGCRQYLAAFENHKSHSQNRFSIRRWPPRIDK